jgi:hypothetical protein
MTKEQQERMEGYKKIRHNIVNLTPHNIKIYDASGKNVIREYPSEMDKKTPVRVQERNCPFLPVDGVPVVEKVYTGQANNGVQNLPLYHPGTFYLVSLLVLQACKGWRDDVLCPDTGPESVVRDSSGNILGIRRFQR